MSLKAATNLISLEDFIRAPMGIFNLFGLKMMKNHRGPKLWEVVLKWISGSFNFLILSQIVMFNLVNFGKEGAFLALTFNFSCCGFSFLSALKFFMLGIRHRHILMRAIDKLDSLFPKTNREQEEFGIKNYLGVLNLQNFSGGFLTVVLFFLFNFTDITFSMFNYFWGDGIYERNFAYFLWFPFGLDGKSPIIFEIFYFIASLGSFFCIFLSMATDWMYCCLMTALCMEFSILSKKFEKFGREKSKDELAQLVKDHYTLIRYSDLLSVN